MGRQVRRRDSDSETPAGDVRRLVVVLGDQLNRQSAALRDCDPDHDVVWMAEVASEGEHVWSHKARIAVFLAAMRHFREALRDEGVRVDYRHLNDDENRGSLEDELRRAIDRHRPSEVVVMEPGAWRLRESLRQVVEKSDAELDFREDDHFFCSHKQFEDHAQGRKQLRLEYFYRELRRRHGVLMNGDEPIGEAWNFDKENRGSFSSDGPTALPAPISFPPDDLTGEVLRDVEEHFPDHPGSLEQFSWPVTAEAARDALDDFIAHRLPKFGQYQDAMWSDEPFLYHATISSALNLKLLDPRDVVAAAEQAYHDGHAPLNAVEGFIRQVLGWREYVRGVYWRLMPGYLDRNFLKANRSLPDFYWTGKTEMECLRQAIGQTLEYGYAHHIQRLMVTGLYAMLLGVHPKAVHEWYLAVYVDAVEWVELPNTLGMSQFADDHVMASKPYAATGQYINRMSNYCKSCRFKPGKAVGEDACPFTTLYWDFLRRHRETLRSNNRMALQLKNVDRKSKQDLDAIADQADRIRESGEA